MLSSLWPLLPVLIQFPRGSGIYATGYVILIPRLTLLVMPYATKISGIFTRFKRSKQLEKLREQFVVTCHKMLCKTYRQKIWDQIQSSFNQAELNEQNKIAIDV